MRKLLPVLVVLLVFPVIFQLLIPGFYASDDGEWMVIRFTSFYQELADFQIPVRFLSRLNNEYGYPVATFLYPGFMYIASLFKVAGFGFIVSIKAVLILSVFSAFIGMFLFLKNHFSQISALVGASLYIYSPYFLWDIYKRGSVGEVVALGIIPVILYCIDSDRRVLASIITALLIISHNTIALLSLPIVLLYLLITQLTKKVNIKTFVSRILLYTILFLGVSAFFWIPAIFELPFTAFKDTTISNFGKYFVPDYELMGGLNIIILLISIIYISFKRTYSSVLYLMVGVSLVSLFLSNEIFSFFWTDRYLGKFVQFPFRFLSLFTVAIAYLGAFLFSTIKQYIPIFAFLCVGFIIVSAVPFISNVEHKDVTDSYYSTNVDTTTVKNEYMPTWVTTIPKSIPVQKIERIDENTVQINTIYWPGHMVVVNGVKVPIDYSNEQGIIRVKTDVPIKNITLFFGETRLRLISDVISLVSVLIATLLIFQKNEYA